MCVFFNVKLFVINLAQEILRSKILLLILCPTLLFRFLLKELLQKEQKPEISDCIHQ